MLPKYLCLLVFWPLLSFAQIDSLKQALNSADTDSLRASLYIQLYQAQLEKDTIKAINSINEASTISKSINNNYLLAQIQNQRGLLFESTFQLDSAIKTYTAGLDILENTPFKKLYLEIKMNLIWTYYSKGQQPKSIVLGYEMLKAYEAQGDTLMIAKSLKAIGVSYDYLSEHETAIELYSRALKYFVLLEDKAGEASTRHNLAGIYADDGHTEKAIGEYEKVIEVIKILGDLEFLAMATNNYGLVYLESDYDKAEELFLSAQKIAIENNDLFHIAFTNQNLTSLYYSKKQYKKAEQFGLKTLEVATKLDDAQLLLNGNARLFDIYNVLGNYKKAIKYLQNANAMEDSTYTKENSQIIQDLQAKYKADKRNAENELLKKDAEINSANIKKQDYLIIFILISLAGVLLTAFIYFRLSYIRKGLVEKVSEKSKEVQRQAEKLKELDEAKSRFFANVSHDLRTPLTLIMGSLERITENKESFLTNESSKDLEMASKNSKRLLFLTNEINELNQLENGRLKLELQPIHVNEFVKLITNMFSSAADSKSIALEFTSSLKQDVFIDADYNHFERIIYNLLSNALKFTAVGGVIKVTIDLHQNVDPNQVQISVIDNGKGISEKSLPFIFDRFYQSLLNEYNAREGFGIGLALVKELVALHNGTIEAQSKENEGSTFTVTCPIINNKALVSNKIAPVLDYDKEWLTSNPEVKTKLKIDIPEDQPVNKEKVLIVEDHPEIRDYINDIIGKHYVTRIASDGAQALEILNNEVIDLVVTDLMMPWMDGFELIENMKANEAFQHLPIMVVSARTNDEDRAKVLDMGVNNYLIKPFNSKELLARIDNLIHSKTNEASNLFVNNEGKLQDLEKDLLKKVESLIIKNISNSKLSVLHLADEMAASERQVYRMIKKLAGITPFEYIKEVRWQYVEYLLKNNKVSSVSEAAKSIGMSNVTDFKRQFKKRFDKEPTTYII